MEALTDQERADILAGVTEFVEAAPTELKEPTAASGLLDNDWQNAEFARLKAKPEMGLSPEAFSAHNRQVWESLGKHRTSWNKRVKELRRSGEGVIRAKVLAHADDQAQVGELAEVLKSMTPDQIAAAITLARQ